MNRVREIRQQKNITQFELARRTGIHVANLHKIEHSIIKPFPGWRRRIAEALEVAEDVLFPAE